ncbi:hypothetical protein ACGVWS_08290 [Enterobacteriaceae bacterium LUAb1]
MQKPKKTIMAITAERKMKLERMAIDASQKAGSQISWTDSVCKRGRCGVSFRSGLFNITPGILCAPG